MPLLKKEPDLYPSNIFDLPAEWRVAHVRSRQEKVLARYLHERQIAFYLPQIENVTERSGRTFRSFTPLFGGYVFIRSTDDDSLTIRRSDVIVSLLDVEDQSQLQSELAQLHQLQQSGATLVPYPELAPGDVVRITEGIFKGYEGVIVRERGELRLVVSISMIRQSVLVELSREGVAPAPDYYAA